MKDRLAGRSDFETLGAPGRLTAFGGLIESGRFWSVEVYSESNAASGAHHLHVARFGTALVAERVLMRDRAFANIGDDLHVGVRVRGKAGVGRDFVVVPDPQRTVTHIFRIVMAAE
jgi:hypothetical protein